MAVDLQVGSTHQQKHVAARADGKRAEQAGCRSKRPIEKDIQAFVKRQHDVAGRVSRKYCCPRDVNGVEQRTRPSSLRKFDATVGVKDHNAIFVSNNHSAGSAGYVPRIREFTGVAEIAQPHPRRGEDTDTSQCAIEHENNAHRVDANGLG